MNDRTDTDGASAPLPRLTLLAVLEAAHALRLAGALPAPPGLNEHRMRRAAAMHPWIRLALGDEAALAMERSGHGGWWMGALLGTGNSGGGTPRVDFDPADTHALMAVDALCSDANGPRWSAWFGIRNRIPDALAREMFPSLDEGDLDGVLRSAPLLDSLEGLLDEVAARFGLSPRKAPADLSAWGERVVDGVAGRRSFREYYPGGALKHHETVPVALADGGEVVLSEHDPVLWPGRYGPDLGTRLRLTWKGATAGHRGYLARVEMVEHIELREAVRRDLERAAAREAFLAAEARGALDANGRRLAEGDRVELVTDCLEASRGTGGRVVEILADMAMVDFGRRGARMVPCYGHALAHAG